MKLNLDCVRDILVFLEENQSYVTSGQKMYLKKYSISDLLGPLNYEAEDIFYSVEHMHETNLIECQLDPHARGNRRFTIYDINDAGHALLGSIREDTTWNHTKEKMASLGRFSISTLLQITKEVAVPIVTTAIQNGVR